MGMEKESGRGLGQILISETWRSPGKNRPGNEMGGNRGRRWDDGHREESRRGRKSACAVED